MGGQQTSPPQVDPNAIPEDPFRRFLPKGYAAQLSGGLKPLDPKKAAANLAAQQESLQTPSIAGELATRDLGPGYTRSFGPTWGPRITKAAATIAPLMLTAGLGGGGGGPTAEELATDVTGLGAETSELAASAPTTAFPKRPPLEFNPQGDPAMTMPMPGKAYQQYETTELQGRGGNVAYPHSEDRRAILDTQGSLIKGYSGESYDDILARMIKAHHEMFPHSPDSIVSLNRQVAEGQKGFVNPNGYFYTGQETTQLERPPIPGATQMLEPKVSASGYEKLLQKLQSPVTEPMTLYDPRPGTPETSRLYYGTHSLNTMAAQGPRYHGTSEPIFEMSHAVKGQSNFYSMHGPGFYTTDNFDVATGYSSGHGGVWNPVARRFEGERSYGPVYRVWETKPNMRFLHIEDEVPPELESALIRRDSNWYGFFHDPNLSGGKTYVESLYNMGNMESVFGDEVLAQDKMQEAVKVAQELGYDGVEHTGGMRSGGEQHNVKIYWDPENQIRIRATGPWGVAQAPMMESSTPEAHAAVEQMAERRQRGEY